MNTASPPTSLTGPALALIGYGEAGRAFADGWRAARMPHRLRAFDINPDRSLSPDRPHALKQAEAVFCLVTADAAEKAFSQIAPFLPGGALVFDGNSCAPETKRANAELVTAAGGRYVDMAIMAPVDQHQHRTPILLSGDHASVGAEFLARLDMVAEGVDGPVGAASSVKMIRSVMVKGLEALVAECVLAARRAGVEERMLASLETSYPGFEWQDRTAYNLDRMIIHGERRAAEMHEVVKTLEALGLQADMARATADWQARIGALGLDPGNGAYDRKADDILAALSVRATKRKDKK